MISFPRARLIPGLLLLSILGISAPPIQALIVVDGRIVPEWPEPESPRSLAKPGNAATGFYPSPKGVVRGLTLLVDFPDQAPAFTSLEVGDWLNLRGFNRFNCNGSVRDYFFDVSNGMVDFQNDVHGYYRAKQPKSYYEGGTGYERAAELVGELLAHFDPLVDFSRFDNDGDGRTEAVSIVYAGTGVAWGKGLWPHSGRLERKLDGVTLARYMMTDLGNRFSLYVFAHECGHMIFGWPDLYWFGDYCLMGNRANDANPVAINDFYRADQGWIPVHTVGPSANAYLDAIHGASGFRFVNPARPGELYFWSNLKNSGRRSALAGKGLLIYHFDNARGGNSSGTSRSLFVVEADGGNNMAAQQWPSPGSSASDFFHAGGRSEFAQGTTPSSRWNDGSASGLRIHSIGPIADQMTFAVGTGVPSAIALPRTGPGLRPGLREGPDRAWFNVKGAKVEDPGPLPGSFPAPGLPVSGF